MLSCLKNNKIFTQIFLFELEKFEPVFFLGYTQILPFSLSRSVESRDFDKNYHSQNLVKKMLSRELGYPYSVTLKE